MPASSPTDRVIDPPRLTPAQARDWTALRDSGLLLALAYGLAWIGLVSISHLLWFLPAGTRHRIQFEEGHDSLL